MTIGCEIFSLLDGKTSKVVTRFMCSKSKSKKETTQILLRVHDTCLCIILTIFEDIFVIFYIVSHFRHEYVHTYNYWFKVHLKVALTPRSDILCDPIEVCMLNLNHKWWGVLLFKCMLIYTSDEWPWPLLSQISHWTRSHFVYTRSPKTKWT